jgi:hypothetical protein
LYGCYSFQANADLEVLEMYGWLQLNENIVQLTNDPVNYLEEGYQIRAFFTAHQDLKGNGLIREVYRSHPYFAINSRISHHLLNDTEINNVLNEKKKYENSTTMLFTIGYEGLSFERYINLLIRHDVRVLCDVRNNPLSRKFGFSKSMLVNILPKINIQYIHIPELGIVSAQRQQLETETDYSVLFENFRMNLPGKRVFVNKVFDLLQQNKRVALTCFEKDPHFCHRHVISQFMQDNFPIKVVDL